MEQGIKVRSEQALPRSGKKSSSASKNGNAVTSPCCDRRVEVLPNEEKYNYKNI